IERNRNADAYSDIRSTFNEASSAWEKAIRLPYLNKFGYNGLYRVNSRGKFNAPYGYPKTVPGFPETQMRGAAHKLASASLLQGSYADAISAAGRGDVVYCDPPYLPTSHADSFTAYTNVGFTFEEQNTLVELARAA